MHYKVSINSEDFVLKIRCVSGGGVVYRTTFTRCIVLLSGQQAGLHCS